jgi:hypothetical protein
MTVILFLVDTNDIRYKRRDIREMLWGIIRSAMMLTMRIFEIILFIGLIISITNFNNCVKSDFNYSTPESKGYSTSKLDTLKNILNKSGTSSYINKYHLGY